MIPVPRKICIKKSPGKGRGVFAIAEIKKGELIEAAPAVQLTAKQQLLPGWNELFDWFFWLDNGALVALGYGSLYNHSDIPNAKYVIKLNEKVIQFWAVRDIQKDEEICTDYRGDSKSNLPLWFDRYGS